jgi:hypothetical protein
MDQVRGYDGHLLFDQVIPSNPIGELYDDLGCINDQADDTESESESGDAFVLVDAHSQNFEDRSPSSPCILERGFMSQSRHPIVRLAEVEREVPYPKKELDCVPLMGIVELVLEELRTRYPDQVCSSDVSDGPGHLKALSDEMSKANGRDCDSRLIACERGHLARETVEIPIAEVMEVFKKMRKVVAAAFEISLDDEDADSGSYAS